MQENIQRRVLPTFATNIALEAEVKVNQKKKSEREAYVRLVFFDTKTKATVAEVVVSRLTAMDLQHTITDMLKKVNDTMKKKTLPKQPVIKAESAEKPQYFG